MLLNLSLVDPDAILTDANPLTFDSNNLAQVTAILNTPNDVDLYALAFSTPATPSIWPWTPSRCTAASTAVCVSLTARATS